MDLNVEEKPYEFRQKHIFDLCSMTWIPKEAIKYSDWWANQENYVKTKATTFDWVGYIHVDDFWNHFSALGHPYARWIRRCRSYIKFFERRNDYITVTFRIGSAMNSKLRIQDFLYTKAKSSEKFCYENKPLDFWDTEMTGVVGGGWGEINWPR